MTESGRIRKTVVLHVDVPGVWQGDPVMPGQLVPPFVPGNMIQEGFLDVEVKG